MNTYTIKVEMLLVDQYVVEAKDLDSAYAAAMERVDNHHRDDASIDHIYLSETIPPLEG